MSPENLQNRPKETKMTQKMKNTARQTNENSASDGIRRSSTNYDQTPSSRARFNYMHGQVGLKQPSNSTPALRQTHPTLTPHLPQAPYTDGRKYYTLHFNLTPRSESCPRLHPAKEGTKHARTGDLEDFRPNSVKCKMR
jgi:hypothetical protein